MPHKKMVEKREDTIRRILNTAAEVFAEAGFAGARMDEIAARTGVNKATIYYHIGDKETLYTRVLHEHFASAGEEFQRIVQEGQSPEEKLSRFIRQIAQVMDQNPNKVFMMLREIAAGGAHLPEIVALDLAAIIGKLGEILTDGEKQGRFIQVNPFSVHIMVIGAFILFRASASVQEKVFKSFNLPSYPGEGSTDVFADEIERLILRALKNRSDS